MPNIDAKPREREVALTGVVEVTPIADPSMTDQDLIADAMTQAVAIAREETGAQILQCLEEGAWAIDVAMFKTATIDCEQPIDRTQPIRIRFTDLRNVRMTVLPVHCDCGKHPNGKVSLWQ